MQTKNGIPELTYYALLDWKDTNRKEWNKLTTHDSISKMSTKELNAIVVEIFLNYKHLPLVGYSVPTIQTITFEPKTN